MFASLLLICSLAFAETKTLAVQICLDREGFSCNTIDGQWGRKSQRALECYCASRKLPVPPTPDDAYDAMFANSGDLFQIVTISQKDIDALIKIPDKPQDKAKLERFGYESIQEMLAERGHLSQRAVERINPGVDWQHVQAGLQLVIPAFPPMEEELSAWPKRCSDNCKRPEASLVKVSLSRFEIGVFGANGNQLALFPCSIAKNKSKLPPTGELKITSIIPNPNYTYTPDTVAKGQKVSRHIFAEGPNNPVGVAWLSLNLPGYGIHGTPRPESIGNAESHGCFRLANWNAARLYAMCKPGTKVIVER